MDAWRRHVSADEGILYVLICTPYFYLYSLLLFAFPMTLIRIPYLLLFTFLTLIRISYSRRGEEGAQGGPLPRSPKRIFPLLLLA